MAKVTLFINQRIIKYSIYAIFTSRVRTTISHNSKSKGFNVSCKLTEDTYAFIVFHESLVNQKNCWGSLVKWYQLNMFLYSSTESKGCCKKKNSECFGGKMGQYFPFCSNSFSMATIGQLSEKWFVFRIAKWIINSLWDAPSSNSPESSWPDFRRSLFTNDPALNKSFLGKQN